MKCHSLYIYPHEHNNNRIVRSLITEISGRRNSCSLRLWQDGGSMMAAVATLWGDDEHRERKLGEWLRGLAARVSMTTDRPAKLHPPAVGSRMCSPFNNPRAFICHQLYRHNDPTSEYLAISQHINPSEKSQRLILNFMTSIYTYIDFQLFFSHN